MTRSSTGGSPNRRHLFTITVFSLLGAAFAKPSPPPLNPQKAKAVAIYAPRPDYPIEARLRRLSGSGMVLLEIDTKTGYVTSAQMEKSMGNPMLDHAALAAFSRWRFKPGATARLVHIPIRYLIGK